MTNPRLGFRNVLYDNRRHLAASSEADDHPVENLADWSAGRSWKDVLSANPPTTRYLYCYMLDPVNRINVTNWYFRDWSFGASSDPDGWETVGTGATVAQSSNAKIHQYSLALTRASANCYEQQTVPSYQQYLGKKVTLGVHVYATVNFRGRISLYDGSTAHASSYHTGSSSYEFLTVTLEVPYNASTLDIRLENNGAGGVVLFDGVALYVGDSVSETPHATNIDYIAVYGHLLGSAARTVQMQTTSDAAIGPSSSWSNVSGALLNPDHDRACWANFTQVSPKAVRFAIAGTNGSGQACIEVLSAGEYVELPDSFSPGFNPLDVVTESVIPTTKSGTPIQRTVRSAPIPLDISSEWVDEASVETYWLPFLLHCTAKRGGKALPFFLQWNDNDYEDETFYCWIGDNSRFAAPKRKGSVLSSVSLSNWMAVSE